MATQLGATQSRRSMTRTRGLSAAVAALMLGASSMGLAASSVAATPDGLVVDILCAEGGHYTVVRAEPLGDYAPIKATDGTVLIPMSYDEATVTQTTDGVLTQVGTLSPSSRTAAQRMSRRVVCSYSSTTATTDGVHGYVDAVFGTMTVIVAGRT